MGPFPRLGPRDLGHNLGCHAPLGEASWEQGWVQKQGSQAASEQTVACRHSWPRHPPPSPLVSSPDKCVSDPSSRPVKHHFKSVEWRTLPIVGTSSSGGIDSDSSWPDERFGLRKVTGHPPQAPSHISFRQMELGARSFSRDSKAEPEGGMGRVSLAPSALQGCDLCPMP